MGRDRQLRHLPRTRTRGGAGWLGGGADDWRGACLACASPDLPETEDCGRDCDSGSGAVPGHVGRSPTRTDFAHGHPVGPGRHDAGRRITSAGAALASGDGGPLPLWLRSASRTPHAASWTRSGLRDGIAELLRIRELRVDRGHAASPKRIMDRRRGAGTAPAGGRHADVPWSLAGHASSAGPGGNAGARPAGVADDGLRGWTWGANNRAAQLDVSVLPAGLCAGIGGAGTRRAWERLAFGAPCGVGAAGRISGAGGRSRGTRCAGALGAPRGRRPLANPARRLDRGRRGAGRIGANSGHGPAGRRRRRDYGFSDRGIGGGVA